MPFGKVKATAPAKTKDPSEAVSDAIIAAARDNARFIRPWRVPSDRDDDPLLRRGCEREDYGDAIILQRRSTGRYDVYSTITPLFEYSMRARTVCQFLQDQVLPNCTVDVSGCYRLCYDDIVSDRENCLVFSKRKDQPLALLPDLYQMTGYTCCAWERELRERGSEPVPFDQKKLQSIFAGAPTGETVNIADNERVRGCVWSASGNDDVSRFSITHWLRKREAAEQALSKELVERITRPHVSVPEQLEHQSVTSIDGNTAAWDRPVWVLGSRSILLKKRSPFECWYYRFLRHGAHYVEIGEWEEVRSAVRYYDANPRERWRMTELANAFVRDFIDPAAAVRYTAALFDAAADLHKP